MGALRIGKMEGNSVILPWHNSGTTMYRVKPVKSNLLLLCSKHSKMYTNSIGVLSNMNRGGRYFLGVHNKFPRMSSYYGSGIKTLLTGHSKCLPYSVPGGAHGQLLEIYKAET